MQKVFVLFAQGKSSAMVHTKVQKHFLPQVAKRLRGIRRKTSFTNNKKATQNPVSHKNTHTKTVNKMSKNINDITELIIAYYPRLRQVFRHLVSIKDVPISMTQLTCLFVLNKNGQLTMSDLADELSMSNQQLTKVVDALCEFEMAERIVDSDNRRKVFAKITPKGLQTISEFNLEISKKLGRLMQTMPEDEIDRLFDCIAHVASYFGYEE